MRYRLRLLALVLLVLLSMQLATAAGEAARDPNSIGETPGSPPVAETAAFSLSTGTTPGSFGTTYIGTITQTGQYDAYTFSANAGDRVFVRLASEWSTWPHIKVKRPDGSLLQETSAYDSGSTVLLVLCPVAGTYAVEVGDREGDSFGRYGIFIQRTNDPGNAVPLGPGRTIENDIESRGQFLTYTVTPAANTDLFLRLSTQWSTWPEIRVFSPDGSLLLETTSYDSSSTELWPACPVTGRYTVIAGDREGNDLGRCGIAAEYIAGPGTQGATATPVSFGLTYSGTIAQRGQFNPYAFAANAGDRVFVRLSSEWSTWPEIKVFNPDGSLLQETTTYDSGFTELLPLCPVGGTYTVEVGDREGDSFGRYGVFIQRTNDPGNAVPLGPGRTIENDIGGRGQFLTYTIWPAATTDLFLRLSTPWSTWPEIKVFSPDGSLLRETTSYDSSSTELWPACPVTGRYTVIAGDREGNDLGRCGITAQYVLGVVAIPGCTGTPADLVGGGLYSDVNGNGRKDFADVVLFFNEMTWIAANEPIPAFDFNGNGRIDFADVVWLFNHL